MQRQIGERAHCPHDRALAERGHAHVLKESAAIFRIAALSEVERAAFGDGYLHELSFVCL